MKIASIGNGRTNAANERAVFERVWSRNRENLASHETLSIVICTKDRCAVLADCLASVARQTRLPEELIVVDASDEPAEAEVATFGRLVRTRCAVRLIRAVPGLTRQRNVGIDASSGSIVLFLDDDVVLEPAYVGEIMAVYERVDGAEIGGIGGALAPDPTPHESALHRAFTRVFLLPGYGSGRVKRSGYPEYLFNPTTETDVQFLSGCNMSYRRIALGGLRFDERLAGYALGEDLEFSHRVACRWRLVLTPHARLDHREAGGGRPDHGRKNEMSVLNHYQFFREQVAHRPWAWLAFLWAAVGRFLMILRHPGQGRLAGFLRGYARILRGDLRSGARSGAKATLTYPAAETACASAELPFVSVVVPVRNEGHFIGQCLDSILGQTYPADRIEVIVVENGSTDGTLSFVKARAAACSRVRLVVSDAANQAAAMNVGIQAACGEIVARVDGHSHLDRDYVRRAVAALGRHPRAAGVGGPFLAAGETLRERVTGLARSARIGVGGGYGADRDETDHSVRTVQCGAYRRNALLAVGGFDVAMAYGEDEELNWRLLRTGALIMLVPGLRQYYRPRATLRALGRQYWNYGRGRVRVVAKHPAFLQVKHLAPSAFVATVAGLLIVAIATPIGAGPLAAILALYGAALAGGSLATPTGWRERLLLPFAITVMHVGYGTGMLWGAVDQFLFGRFQRRKNAQEESRWQCVIEQSRNR